MKFERILLLFILFSALQQTLCSKNENDFINPFLEQTSIIDDCCCSITSVVDGNNDLNPLLNTLVSKRFFQYFKLDLFSDCPFWVTDLVCGTGGCAICECDEDEVPRFWEKEKTDLVERLHPPSFSWLDTQEEMWTVQGKEDNMAYVNLARYPESYTGYNGRLIWDTIYKENCFSEPLESMCLEQRVFYRLISGLHTSINIHIARYYEKNSGTGDWDCNLDFFEHRILNHPERIKNLYFVFLFLVRAVNKAAPTLIEYDYDTGNQQESTEVRQLMKDFLNTKLLCSPNFDESMLFLDPQKETLKQQFKQVFRNISLIMNCVTCEKCKVYSKLQTLGVGTALKILFDPTQNAISQLQRNEIIALINTLRQFSNSVKAVEYMSSLVEQKEAKQKQTKPTDQQSSAADKKPPVKKEQKQQIGFSNAFIGGVAVLGAMTWLLLKPYNEEEAQRINRQLRREQGYTKEDEEWEQEEEEKQKLANSKPKSD